MEMEFFSLVILPLLVFFLTYLLVFQWIHKKNHRPVSGDTTEKKLVLPPGRSGWPLIGESLDWFSKVQHGVPENFLTERRKRFGSEIFWTSLIGQQMAILSGSKGNKFLFSNENKLVQVWWPSSVDRVFPNPDNKAHHEDFRNARIREMLSAFLKADALQRFVSVADNLMKESMQRDWGGQQIVAYDVIRKYTFSLACRLLLSIDNPGQIEKLSARIDDISRGLLSLAVNFPGTAFNRAIVASQEIRKKLEGVIRQRKNELSENRASPSQDILSQMLMTRDDRGQFLNEHQLSSNLLGLLHGGYGTVSSVLTSIMKYLAEHPDVYQQVLREQQEMSKSKEVNGLLNWEDLRKMRYSWNVGNEVLRLAPPAFGAFREAITDFTYAGYTIPKGWKLHWIANETHKNPEYFHDPEKFDPSRFEGNGPAPYTFVPFGGGSRMCPGNEYTRMVILVFMHNVVTRFRWEKLIPDEKVVCDPHPRPAKGLHVRLYPH